MIKCTKCNYEFAESNKKCPKCGTEVKIVNKTTPLLACPKCKARITSEDIFCGKCGEKIKNPIKITSAKEGKQFDIKDYDQNLINSPEQYLNSYLQEKIKTNKNTLNTTLPEIETRKTIMSIILSAIIVIMIMLYVSYHTSLFLMTVIISISIFIYYKLIVKYDIKKYIIKQISLRPDEKIDYVTTSILSSGKPKKFYTLLQLIIVIAPIICATILFSCPHYIYESYSNGYALRYYTLGLIKEEREVVIPKMYKGKEVIAIRGDVFKNVKSIKKVSLPESITEIRGGAFENCKNLEYINIPPKITEIHGSTFEGCIKLDNVVIPEGVTRIGGSAFRECVSLENVTIPKSVNEIGSSAFRLTKIEKVCISKNTYVNERAFKETYPTITYYEDGCISVERDGYNSVSNTYDNMYYNYESSSSYYQNNNRQKEDSNNGY